MKKNIIVLAAMLTLLAGCSKSKVENEIKLPIYGGDEISFEIAEAKVMDLTETNSMGAVLDYPYPTYLTFPADALVTSWNIVKGREVKQGDILAELDSSGLDYELNNQRSITNAAEEAASGGEIAQINYEIEQYKLEMLSAEKEKYIIRAPFDGIITYVNRSMEGDNIKGGEVCCAVSESDRAFVYIDGGEASQFRFGQKVQVKIDNNIYGAFVSEAPDISPEGASQRAVFSLEDGVMKKIREENPMAVSAGWATVYVTKEKKNVLAVPDSAVKSSGMENYVTIVDGEERYKLKVIRGQSIGGFTEILGGISEGDIVMAEGSGVFYANSAAPTE